MLVKETRIEEVTEKETVGEVERTVKRITIKVEEFERDPEESMELDNNIFKD